MMEDDMGPGMEIQTFDRIGLLGRRWYFRIVDAGNWEPLATSEAYNRPFERNETAERFRNALQCPMIPERKR